MLTTTNFKLRKIELTDSPPDITVLNFNWDTLDTNLQEALTKAKAWDEFSKTGGSIGGKIVLPTGDGKGLYVGDSRIIEAVGGLKLMNASGRGLSIYDLSLNPTHLDMSLGEEKVRWKEIWLGSINKSLKGYCSLPNGMLMQWGYANDGTQTQQINLPLAFSNNNYIINVTPYPPTLDLSGFSYRTLEANTGYFKVTVTKVPAYYWLAIGW